MAIRVPPGGSSLGSFLFTTSALALGGPSSQIVAGWAPDVALDIDFTIAAPETWSPSDKSVNITLSNADLTAIGTNATDGAVRSLRPQTAGKFYFEVAKNASTPGTNTGSGIATSAAVLGTVGSTVLGALVVYFATGNVWFNGVNTSVSVGGGAPAYTFCFAVDLTNQKVWVRRDGGDWNGIVGNNPATNTGGINIASLFSTNSAFAIGTFNIGTTTTSTINFGNTAFAQAVPSGFSAWKDISPQLDPRITFARGSTATYYNSSGLIVSAASGALRFDYDPVALTPRGLLLEEQRTNLCLQSDIIGTLPWNSYWDGSGSTPVIVASGAASPAGGGVSHVTISRSDTASHSEAYQPFTGTATVYTGSIWLKAFAAGDVGKVIGIALHNGAAALPGQLVTLTAGWVRYATSGTLVAGGCNFQIGYWAGDGGNTGTVDFDAWGGQVELGAFATSYIPTTTVAVTRSADTAEMTGANFSGWYNASAGTFVAEYRPQSVSGTQPVISVNDTTANEAIRLYGSGTDPKAIVVDGGATQADLDAGTITVNTFAKLGLAFTLNDFAACLDGGTVATDVVGTLPTVTQLQFHTDIAGNVANLHIKRLQFFGTRKTDSELQALTAASAVGTGALVAQAAVAASTTGISGSTSTNTAALDLDFTTGTLDPRITFTRASTATYFDSTGVLQTASSGAARFDYDPITLAARGLLIEASKINNALWNRDLTNAVWAKTNVTAAKNQTGIDGATNSASSITATAANGTCLQTITLASSARLQSAYVKRLTGSGVVNVTTDNGTTWTAVPVTGSWTRVSIPVQTITNPIVGFRLVTSGDAIAVDYVQNELSASTGVELTSPIATTTVAVTRAADVAVMTSANFSSWYNANAGTFVFHGDHTRNPSLGNNLFAASDNSTSNQINLLIGSGGTNIIYTLTSAGAGQFPGAPSGAVASGTPFKVANAYALNDAAICIDSGTVVTDITITLPVSINRLYLGLNANGAVGWLNGHIKRLTYYDTRLSNATLQALTSEPSTFINPLTTQSATLTSTTGVSGSLITDTTLNASPAVLASTTGVSGSIAPSVALAAQAATAASTTGLSRSIAAPVALAAQQSVISGLGGAGTILVGTGVVTTRPALVAGAGLTASAGIGALQVSVATIDAHGVSAWIATAANLNVAWADINGLGEIPYNTVVSGPYAQVGDLWEGAAVWGKIAGKWRRMRLWSRSAAAWGMVAWDKDAQEVDVISEPAYGVLAVRSANVNGAGFIRDQFWGTGDLRAGPALVTDSSSLSGLSVITNAAWEATPLWVKANGKWRRATMWTNVSAEWKRVA